MTTFNNVASTYNNNLQLNNHFINLNNFNPYHFQLQKTNVALQDNEQPDLKIKIKPNNKLLKETIYEGSNNANQFPERFFDKGHLKYASYPFCGFYDENQNSSVGILITRDYDSSFSSVEKLSLPENL